VTGAQAAKQARSHYLIAGLAIGGLSLLNRDKSLLYHALQMLAVMSVLTVLQIVLRRRGDEAPASPSAYARLIGAKLVLVALAVGAEWLLAPVTPRSNAIVAAAWSSWSRQSDQCWTDAPAPSTPGDVPPGPPFTERENP
jgi:hypothetical protein